MKTIDNRIARTLVLVVSLILSFPVFGQNADAVDLRLASLVGENFIRLNGNIALSGEPGSLRRVETDKFPNLYIFNADEHGFIIVAGDKRVQPILGFSDEGTFDPNDMAPAAEMIIGSYDYVVDSMVRYNVRSVDESVRQAWIDLENGYYREVKGNREDEPQYPLAYGPLIRTNWGQGDCILWEDNFNQQCPWYDSISNSVVVKIKAKTGCVAVAMSQLLYYFNKNIPSTDINCRLFSKGEHTFKLLDKDGDTVNSNDNQIHTFEIGNWDYSRSNMMEFIAKMMLDCGLTVNMDYGTDGSGASIIDALNAFKSYYGFPNAKKIETVDNEMLQLYISNEVPLYFRGKNKKGKNHAYIVDGYMTTVNNKVYFHHNLGSEKRQTGYWCSIDNPDLFCFNQKYIALMEVPFVSKATMEFGESDTIEISNKTYIFEYGEQSSVSQTKIVYNTPGDYRIYDRIDNIDVVIFRKVMPINVVECSFHKSVCVGDVIIDYPKDEHGNIYEYILSSDSTNFEGSRDFVRYSYDNLTGSVNGKCTLTVSTGYCCQADLSGLRNNSDNIREESSVNQIIYKSVTKYYEYVNAMKEFLSQVLMEAYWVDEEKGIEFWNLFQSLLDSNTGLISEEGIQQLISQNQLENISDEYIRVIAEGYNQSVMYWNEGYYTNESLPEGYGGMIEYDTAAMRKAYEAQAYAESLGFSDVRQMYDNAYEMLESEIENQQTSVCARVTVQFNQKMTMTREAFNGTLQIFNGHESIPMENIFVDFRIEDQQGNNCTNLFQINTLSLDQITGISGDGSLAAQTNGTALVQFIPTRNAAPTQPTVYYFGGSFCFIDPFTGEGLTYPLYPVDITVNPSPDLYVDYFMQRDILGDDALTLGIIEPSIPAELGVIIHNKGAGIAKNVTLETAEPEIIDNEHGLAIEFAMYGASFNGSPRQLGLMEIPFGNIESGQTAVGEWLFTSSLLGHFVSYTAHVIHNSSYDNPDLSLVSHLDIHELIHPIYAYGNLDDGINDFLVNDNPDAYDTPDSIYFSHGGKTSVSVVDNISFNHYVSPSDTIVKLTIVPSRIGWNYGVTDDPGMSQYDIVRCIRNNDHREIPLNNVWQTFVTIPDGGDPVYENKLHIVDTIPVQHTTTYTLIYSLKPNLLCVEDIVGIPTESFIDYPLTSFQVKFNEPIIDSTFTYEDMTLKCQNGPNLMNPTVGITKVTDSLYNVNIEGLTNESGYYVLNVNANGIKDTRGYFGYNGKQASWVQVLTSVTQTTNMQEGWNWWSTNIEQEGIDGLSMLENSLGHNGVTIKSQNEFIDNYYQSVGYNYWFGSLVNLQNEKCYLINAADNCTAEMTGALAAPQNHPITIQPNWNWIGYPVAFQQAVGNAFDDFTPSANDAVKGQFDFASYYEGYGWFPDDFMMTPGKGYLYQSNAPESKTLVYSSALRNATDLHEEQLHYWNAHNHAYPDNFNSIAVVMVDGVEQRNDKMELGAFVNGECRGSVRLRYFAPLDRYFAMLTVTGEAEEEVSFALVDTEGGETLTRCDDRIAFAKDVVIGSFDEPYEVHFNTMVGMEEEWGEKVLTLYPNPVRRNQSFSLNIPMGETVSELIITDAVGDIVRHETGAIDANTVKGFQVTGVYVIKAIAKSGNIYHGRIIVD